MRRFATWLLEALAWVVIALLALVGSVVFHLDTTIGHRVVKNLTNGLVTDLIAGRLEIGRVDHVGLDDIRVAHVALYDRKGVKVIQADRIILKIDPIAGLRGELLFSHAELYHAFLKLDVDEEGDITFLDALEERIPTPPSANPLHAYVEDMHLHDVTAYGTFLGLHDLRAEDLEVHMRLEFTEETKVQIFSGRGRVVRPFPFVGELDAVTTDIRGDAHRGIEAHARAHTGDNRVNVIVKYRVPEGRPETDPSELDLLVHADPVDMPKLVELGFDWADLFVGRARGYVRLYGPTDSLQLSGELTHDAGEVTLRGSLPSEGDVRIQAVTPGVELTKLFTSAPELRVGGNVTLTIPDAENVPPRLHANTEPFEYLGYQIPAADLDTNLEEDRARVLDLRAPYGGGTLRGSGVVRYDGSFDVTVSGHVNQVASDPNVQRHAEGARGSLDVTAHVRADVHDNYVVDAEGAIGNLFYADVTAAQSTFAVHTKTGARGTQLRVDADAHGARVFDLPIGDGHIGVDGVGNVYDYQLAFAEGDESSLRSSGRVELRGRGYRVDVPVAELSRHGVTWIGSAEGLDYSPGRFLHVERIRAAQHGGDEATQPQIYASGTWQARGADDLRLEARGIDLAMMRAMFAPNAPSVGGIVDIRADVSGDVDTHPNITVDGLLYEGQYEEVHGVDGAFFGSYDGHTLSTDVQIDLEGGGRLLLAGEGRFVASIHDFTNAAKLGDFDVTASADNLDLARLAPLFGSMGEGVGGRAQGTIHATGPIFLQPNFQGRLSIPQLSLPGFRQPLDVDLETRYDLGSLAVHLSTGDAHGTLVEGDGSVLIDIAQTLSNPRDVVASLSLMPWRFGLRVPPRLVANFPDRLTAGLPEVAREFEVAASLSLAGGGIRTRGSLVASFEHASHPERFVCARDTHPRGHLVATLEDDVTRATLTALVANDAAARVQVSARTPIDDWLSEAVKPAMPPVNVDVSVDSADLANVPYFCENFRGPLTGEVAIHGLFTDSPTIGGTLESAELRIRRLERTYVGALHVAVEDTPPIRLSLGLNADSSEASIEGAVHFPRFGVTDQSAEGAAASEPCTEQSHDCTAIHGDVAWTWNSTQVTPRIDGNAPLELQLAAHRMPLQLPLAFISFFGRTDGVVDGTVTAHGTLAEPHLGGSLVVSEGRVDLRTLGQRLRDVHGEVRIHDDKLELHDFEARDGDGRAGIEGEVDLHGFSVGAMHLRLDAEKFPFREDSTIVATLTGHAGFEAALAPGRLDGTLGVRDLSVQMPEEEQREPISLSEHQDIHIRRLGESEEAPEAPYRVQVALDASRGFTVKSRDFTAQVAASLNILYADPDFRVDGTATIRRGNFEVMGKRFQVEQGSLVFDGGTEINPVVNLVATTQLRGGGNASITVRATGTLADPQITFTSPLVPSGDQGQIICLLMTGSATGQCGENQGQTSAANTYDATRQAASFISGVAFGLLTLSLREQFGAFIPVLSVESGQTGAQSVRVRAGFNANALIPRRLRGVVQGMYIEGFFSTNNSNPGGLSQQAAASSVITSQSLGFSMELQFPHSIVGTGAFAPPNNFSLDLTWQP